MRKIALTFALAAMASIGLVACGGGSSSSTSSAPATTSANGGGGGGGGASSSVKLAADPSQIAYDTNSLTAKAGNVTIDFNNPNNALPHDVCVQDPNGKKLGCTKPVTGGSETLDLSNLKAGSYTFYCSVDSHEAAGMKGTLNVQ